jgi:hypothetical protein
LDKKQKFSWGVSFGSIALVAGMVSYFGLSNGGASNNQLAFNQGQPSNNNANQQLQDAQTPQGPEQRFDPSFGGDESSQFNSNGQGHGRHHNFDQADQFSGDSNQFGDNNQSSGNSDQFGESSQSNQFSMDGGPMGGHQGVFDTTTGGT